MLVRAPTSPLSLRMAVPTTALPFSLMNTPSTSSMEPLALAFVEGFVCFCMLLDQFYGLVHSRIVILNLFRFWLKLGKKYNFLLLMSAVKNILHEWPNLSETCHYKSLEPNMVVITY